MGIEDFLEKNRGGLKTPDSIQIAVGVMVEANAFLTNDLDFKEIDGVKIVQLSNFRRQ